MYKMQSGQYPLVPFDKNFDISLTLFCGQAFRWKETDDGWHGVAFGKPLTVRKTDDGLLFLCTKEDFEIIWQKYFDLDTDYGKLCETFSADKHLKSAVTEYPGIHILRQDTWEALCSFIISQNNNIPRICGIIDRLCTLFGDDLENGDFTFPSAEKLATLSVDDLAPLRAGFRSKYIIDAAVKCSDGTVNLKKLGTAPLEEARAELMKIKGVGPKVAECTLLYGAGRMQAFPVDVWVKRILHELYSEGLPDCIKDNEGIAQQYLFHWRRNQKSTSLTIAK